MSRRLRTFLSLFLGLALLTLVGSPSAGSDADEYRNPLQPRVPGDGRVQSCADPTVIRGQQPGDRSWYMYCTTDPLNDGDTAGSGDVVFHPIPMMRSQDLVNWTYVGDALPEPPSWAADGAGLWAPDVVYSKTYDRYYMTFVVTDVDEAISGEPNCTGDGAIGVATSRSPTGPWRVSDTPVVAPRREAAGCNFYWTFDPDVLGNKVKDRSVLYYGSYFGGIFGTHVTLHRHGMTVTGTPQRVTVGNRYEGANVVRRGDWYYLFASATNCCNGPLTGYSVFAGRSKTPLGTYRDREGNSLLAGRVGGTPVLSMNGNRWVGTGHNTVFRDFDGQWWTVYHAVNRFDPYFKSEPGFTKRPVLLDPLAWVNGWPSVRAGRWASNKNMPAPAAQPGEQSRYRAKPWPNDRVGRPIWRLSDEFRSSTLSSQWSWVREPAAGTSGVGNGRFRFTTQEADLYVDSNNASVLTEPAPKRDYVVQTKVRLPVPATGCCYNFVQAGLVIYGNDDKFVKLTHTSIYETRQTEFAKEVAHAPDQFPRYGNTVVGPPSDWTYLRIVKRHEERPSGSTVQLYTAYTSQDGRRWVRGGTWTHRLGDNARIGLVSMGAAVGGEVFNAKFDYVRVWSAAPRR
ncbi:MAG: family 43 glycosylhydrolase [Propionibacteriales bacterium]|nr:family 43 glycosylhydrolase [Propionibacteriales bacterium]